MRGPKDSDPKDKQGSENQPPAGGNARKRVEQFNRQRGIPSDTAESDDDEHSKKKAPDDKP